MTSPFNTHNTHDNDKDNEPFPLTSDMNLESLPTESPKAMASKDLALAHMGENGPQVNRGPGSDRSSNIKSSRAGMALTKAQL